MRRFLAALLAMCISLSLFGCSTDVQKPKAPPEPNPPVDVDIDSEKKIGELKLKDNEITTMAEAITDVLYKNENIMISPLSISMALAVAANGANGETREEIEAFLGMDLERFNEYAKQIMENVKNDETLDVANGLWASNSVSQLKEDYRNLIVSNYDGEVKLASMDMGTVKEINDWVSEKTRTMIPKLLDELSPEVAAVIVNAVYFDALWEEPFEDYQVEDGDFHGFNGDKTVKMMSQRVNKYMENDKAIAFEKDYEAHKYSFIGILPKEEGEFSLSDIDLKSLLDSKTYEYDVDMKMPKFEFEFDSNISNVLQSFGIKTAFDRANADFTNMFENSKKGDFWISSVVHKTKIEVSEKGTKAAAVTGIIMETCAAPIDEPEVKTVELDRPFAFVIMDNENNVPLFVGKVVNP